MRVYIGTLVVLALVMACTGCGDSRMRKRIASLDDATLTRILPDYEEDSTSAILIKNELTRRGVSFTLPRDEHEAEDRGPHANALSTEESSRSIPAVVKELTFAALQNDVTVKCRLSSQDLFNDNFIKIGDGRGAVLFSVENRGTQDLDVGHDLYVLVGEKTIYFVNTPGLSDDDRRALLYATYADYFTALDKGTIVNIGFSAWGQQFRIAESVSKHYRGRWSTSAPAKGSATIQQQVTTWPGGSTGWVATSVLRCSTAAPGFRILGKFGGDGSVTDAAPMHMSVRPLMALANDQSKPMAVREWSLAWLADVQGGAEQLVAVLQAKTTPEEMRNAAVRWLAVRHPGKGLPAIDKALWDEGTPEKMQTACYYAFDWALTPDATKAHQATAWSCIERAVKHPNKKVSEAAKKKLASKK